MKIKLQYLYLLAFVLIVIAVAEFIGIQSIQVGSVKSACSRSYSPF